MIKDSFQQNIHFPKALGGLFCVFALFLITSGCKNRPTSQSIEGKYKQKITTSPSFSAGFTGFALYDPLANTMLYEHNAAKYFLPASNIKLFTFYAALNILGDSIPAFKYTIQGDSLIFKGTADPSFLHPDVHNFRSFNFLNFAKENLYYVSAPYTSPRFGPGWAWDDYNYYYSTERAPFPIYGNIVRFQLHGTGTFPTLTPLFFKNKVEIGPNPMNSAPVFREPWKNEFVFAPAYDTKKKNRDVPFIYSSQTLIELLNDTLQNKVSLLPSFKGSLNKVLYSTPADTLYKKMLQDSDNFIAEQILLLCSSMISDSLSAELAINHVIKTYLEDLPDKPKWVDGSGLSRYNLVTPRAIISILERIYHQIPLDRLFYLFPQGGKTGSLKTWSYQTPSYIHAKTGSMSNTQNISGYLVAKSGRVLIFSFMTNNQTIPPPLLKQEMEMVLKEIYESY